MAKLLLPVLLLRGVIPVGFMPDVKAAASGMLQPVICTGGGAEVLTIDEGGKAARGDAASHADSPCAFVAIAELALLGGDTNPVQPFNLKARQFYSRAQYCPPPARAGPQLGSRTPPFAI